MDTRLSKGLWALGAFLSVGVALYAWHYLTPLSLIPPDVARNLFVRPWLVVHAGLAGVALALGPFQFLPGLRARRPRLHRWSGRIYVFACLVGGGAGLALALGSSAGPIAQSGFAALAVIWLACTGQAFRLALAGRYQEHRRWMVRSFAMTFAAVTLRLYLPIGPIFGLDFMDAYRAIAWISWVPNLLVAELYLARGLRKPLAARA